MRKYKNRKLNDGNENVTKQKVNEQNNSWARSQLQFLQCSSNFNCASYKATMHCLKLESVANFPGCSKVNFSHVMSAHHRIDAPLRYWQTRTRCCGHILAHDVSWARKRAGHKMIVVFPCCANWETLVADRKCF